MKPNSPYQFRMFSRRMGDLKELRNYSKDILTFYQTQYPETNKQWMNEKTDRNLEKTLNGAVLAFDGERAVGYMSFAEVKNRPGFFYVVFSYVEFSHRRKKIWTIMSQMVEEEVRHLGGEEIWREINIKNQFLVEHLQNENGYQRVPRDPILGFVSLARRL